MKNILIVSFCLVGCVVNVLMVSVFAQNTDEVLPVVCVQLDPLEKVFTEESYFVENPETAAVAKGETATFQFVIRSAYPIQELKIEAGNLMNGDQRIAATLKAFVGYIRAGNHAGKLSKDAVLPISDYYPDCLQEIDSIDVPPMQNQPVWVSYAIPRDAADGNYSATLTFTGKLNGQPFQIAKQVNAKVYPVTLPEQTLWVTNWWVSSGFSKMNGNQPVENYSDRYWELLTAMAHVMRDHGQNTYIFWDWPGLCKIELSGTQYSFDFANFDTMVELLIREGGLQRIEGGHLGGRMGGWDSDFGVSVPKSGTKPIDDEAVQNFLSQFLPALYSHLEAKGWKDRYVQHIADEPTDQNAESYLRITEFVKKQMPGIPIVDALSSKKLVDFVDVWVPILDHYHKEYAFYQERQAAGDEIWFYTCTGPQGNYANRFMEQPLVQTRFLHWINYRYGSTGYLHWGFNFWHMNTTNDAAVNNWPAGDSWIVYPKEGGVFSSIRLAAMRDGINDYGLLKLLEQKAPGRAKALAGAVIQDFDSYNSNVRAFRQTRLKLLEELSQ
ncbi:MAG: DUF4091 domain-containing protein [Planctomycetaceae bacterium]|nr:DUF4091 domain-containing protein [Planctomycetaceae bacterium]